MIFSGITRRWIINIFCVILIFLMGFMVVFSIVVYNFYYSSTKQYLTSTAKMTQQSFKFYADTQNSEFFSSARALAESFTEKDTMEMQILDLDGNIIFSTSGFVPKEAVQTPDFAKIRWSGVPSVGSYTGKNQQTNEHVMAVSATLSDYSGNVKGIVRFVISLNDVDRYIFFLIALTAVLCVIVLALVLLSGGYFINSIVRPVGVILDAAQRIAKGDLSVRLEKTHKDEIGVLADSINFMAQELSQTEKMQTEFISSISHELRTPLTAITGWSETMQACDDDKETMSRGLEVINNEATRLSQMVEELLDFSRVEAGRFAVDLEKTDIGQVIMESVFTMKERARLENIILEYTAGAELPYIMGDFYRLKQVLINVLDNSIKHSHKEGVVNLHTDYDGENIEITITDSGVGIPQEYLGRVKEKFFKGPSSKRGSGLGLAIGEEIIKLHGGTLEIESVQNEGTTVVIKIPAEKRD